MRWIALCAAGDGRGGGCGEQHQHPQQPTLAEDGARTGVDTAARHPGAEVCGKGCGRGGGMSGTSHKVANWCPLDFKEANQTGRRELQGPPRRLLGALCCNGRVREAPLPTAGAGAVGGSTSSSACAQPQFHRRTGRETGGGGGSSISGTSGGSVSGGAQQGTVCDLPLGQRRCGDYCNGGRASDGGACGAPRQARRGEA